MSPEAASSLSQPRRFGSSAGQPLTRRDGLLKVTGRATYAADNHPEGMLYAVTAASSIARGTVKALDVAAAKSHPGVVEVMTPANRPPLAHDPEEKIPPFGFRVEVLQDDSVRYANQPIALVMAETFEAATEGAALLRPQYETEPVRATMESGVPFEPGAVGVGSPPRTVFGDIEAGFAAASHITESDYATPAQYHNAMEPHAVVAQWDGDRLTLDMPNQAMALSCASYGAFFGVPRTC
jgi:xanthine dehydrogenase YagR molybdenum-binding subunit